MMKTILFSLVAAGLVLFPVSGFAQTPPNVSGDQGAENIEKATEGTGGLIPDCIRLADETRKVDANCVLDSIVFYTNILLVVVTIGAFAYMLYGAFQYATAFGDESKIALAKKTITHAIIGVLIAGVSVMLVQLVKTLLKA